jgi:molybdopterin converting factor small subunit
MKIHVRYFAAVKEQLGPEQWLDVDLLGPLAPRTIEQLRRCLIDQSAAHARALEVGMPLRAALNQAVCDMDTPLAFDASGVCEVAFFPPVTGG